MTRYRARAIEILQIEMPAKLIQIQDLLNGEEDPESALHPNRASEGPFVKVAMFQPGSSKTVAAGFVAGSESSLGNVVMPQDICQCMSSKADDVSASMVKKVKKVTMQSTGSSMLDGIDEDETDGEAERGASPSAARTGVHWFEIFPQNKVQCELIDLCTT